MNILKKLGNIYNKLEEYMLVYTLVFCVGIVFLQVIMRYVFNNSLSWSEELCKYLFVWMIWLGTSITAREHGHIAIDMLKDKARGWGKYLMNIIVNLAWLTMCLFLLFNGITVVEGLILRGKTASALPWLKVWVVYLAIPISQGVLSIRILLDIVQDVLHLIRRDDRAESNAATVEGGVE